MCAAHCSEATAQMIDEEARALVKGAYEVYDEYVHLCSVCASAICYDMYASMYYMCACACMICMHLYDICARMIDEEVRDFMKGAYEVCICTCMAYI